MERESYTRSEIYELLWTEPATKVALRIGLSDVALGKWCKQYGVPKPPLGYWAKLEHGKVTAQRPPLEPWWNEHDPLIHVRTRDKAIMEARLNKPAEPIPVIEVYKGNKFHEEIEKTFKDFEMENHSKFGRSESKAGFDVQIGPHSVPRVKRILQALINEFTSRGYRLGGYRKYSNPEVTAFMRDDDVVTIEFYEVSTKPPKPMKRRSSWTSGGHTHSYMMDIDYIPSGRLELRIRHNDIYGWKIVKDSEKTSVEEQLGKLINLIAELSFDAKIARVEREASEAREQAERKRLADIKWAREVDAWKWGQLKEKTYDWPELTKDRIFDMVDLRIRAGTTGAPDGMEDKESWLKVLPMIANLSIQMQNLQARGMDYEHIRNLLHETLLRYDDRIDSNLFIPNVEKQAEGWSRDDDPNLGMNWFSERKQKSGTEMNYSSNLLKEETGNDASSK